MRARFNKLMSLIFALTLLLSLTAPTVSAQESTNTSVVAAQDELVALAAPAHPAENQEVAYIDGDSGFDYSLYCDSWLWDCYYIGYYVAIRLSDGEQQAILYGGAAVAGSLIGTGCGQLGWIGATVCGAFSDEAARYVHSWIQNDGTCGGNLVVKMSMGLGVQAWCE
jgi:hypothetical protein